MRLIVLSDRMYGGMSAYSKHSFEICTRFAALGHKVAHIPMGFANFMGKTVYKNVLVYNSDAIDGFGETVAVPDYIEFKADMLITNKEPWVFQSIHRWAINFVPMAIIDHAPVSGQILSRLGTAFKVIAISRFGQRELKKAGFESVYIPLGVRTDIYRPFDKAASKKAFFLSPDEFVVGIVAMNRSRKMIPQMLRGYKRFLEQNPDVKSHMMLWTNVLPSRPPTDTSQGVADVGVNLVTEIHELGLGDKVNWIKWDDVEKMGGLPEFDPTGSQDMVRLYNSFDVNLLCSGGEGAGLPYLEANACGVPSLYTNYAAAPEYAGPSGIPVNAENYVIINTPGTRYYLADIDGIAEALRKVYDADREKLAKRCRAFAEKMSWGKVMEDYWVPFLSECQEELYPKISKTGTSSWRAVE
jgi:glycosyltransferase involved in cell wall biosynthesis